jgi:DNA-binding NarL/FixJ family response regulator
VLSFLTDREWQVLKCVSDGLSTEEIATELCVRRSTARTHVQNVLTKLGVHSRLQAAALVSANSPDFSWPRHVR